MMLGRDAVPSLEIELRVIVRVWSLNAMWQRVGDRLRGCGKCQECLGALCQALHVTDQVREDGILP
jgi:hypothetical protein